METRHEDQPLPEPTTAQQIALQKVGRAHRNTTLSCQHQREPDDRNSPTRLPGGTLEVVSQPDSRAAYHYHDDGKNQILPSPQYTTSHTIRNRPHGMKDSPPEATEPRPTSGSTGRWGRLPSPWVGDSACRHGDRWGRVTQPQGPKTRHPRQARMRVAIPSSR